MNIHKKINLKYAFLASILFFGLYGALPVFGYTLLQPLPGLQETSSFANYIQKIIPFVLILAAVLAVVQLVIGGMQYALSESIFNKEDAKDRITQALLGLLIALVSWIILNTINPDLVNLIDISPGNINIPQQSASQQNTTGPWSTQDKQTQLSTRTGGTVTCFTYNPTIDRRGTVTFGDGSSTVAQLMAQCQQQCVQAGQSTGTQAECIASSNTTNNSAVILPSQARCTATGQCSATGTGAPCENPTNCTVTTAPPGQKTFCVLDKGGVGPDQVTASAGCVGKTEVEQVGCSQASCQVPLPIRNSCGKPTAGCITK